MCIEFQLRPSNLSEKKTSEFGEFSSSLCHYKTGAGWQLVCFIIKYRTYVCKAFGKSLCIVIVITGRYIIFNIGK